MDVFNVNEIRWRMLKSLAITDGRIKKVQGKFRMMTPTQCLNLSNNALMEVENNSLIRLAQLTTLDLSYNNLTHLPALNIMNGREFWLDISGINGSIILLYLSIKRYTCINISFLVGTNTLSCHDVYQYINKTGEKQITFNRENETVCSSLATWHWFNTTERVPLTQLLYLSSVCINRFICIYV